VSPVIKVDVIDGLIDQPRHFHAYQLTPGIARLTASLDHPDGSRWQSSATFLVGEDGALDPDTALPLEGDWAESEPMAPIWALRRITPPVDPTFSDTLQPRHVTLTITDAAGQTADTAIIQRFLAAGVIRHEVRANGLSGTLFSPSGDGPHPLVIVLNGSGGGTPEQRAALLAAHGYLGFALAYFKAPGRPETISATPLEYFATALDWVHETLHPRNGFIAVTGHSRGGELALLLGATFPDRVSAVIGYVPSAVIHGTLRAGRPDEPRDATAWTWRGQPLRNIWQDNPHADWHAFDHPAQPGVHIRQAPAFVNVERDAQSLAAARIPVERIAGPVLLISGTDDGFWPSDVYCQRINAELTARQHRWPVIHQQNDRSGHAIGFPFVPTTEIARVHPVAGVVIDGGGTPAANARANRQSWAQVLDFLAEAVAAHREET